MAVTLLPFAAATALLLASLANYLTYNGYPLLRPDVGLVALGALAVAGVVAIAWMAAPLRARPLVEGLLAAWFVDFNSDSIPLIVAVGLIVAAIGWWKRISLLGPMAVLGSVVLITTALGLGRSPRWIKVNKGAQPPAATTAEAPKPAILHLLLDEHIGIEGLRAEGPNGERLSDELRANYVGAGYAVYGGAHSRYFDTVNAVPDVLNYGERLGKTIRKGGVEVGPTEHFTALTRAGYRLTIFQSDYADYCSGTVFRECVTYDSGSLRPTLGVPMAAGDRAQLIALKFLALSDIFRQGAKGWNAVATPLGLPLHDSDAKNSSTVGSLAAMPALERRVEQVRPGDAIFAHLLLPHYPYAVWRDCRYRPWPEWDGRHSDEPIEQRRLAYYEQVRCTTARVLSLVRAFTKAAGPDSIVIIHGDHGSRITRVDPYQSNMGKIGREDLIAGFSTLFAIRAPGVGPGYTSARAPIPQLLGDFSKSGFAAPPRTDAAGQARVYVVARRSKRPVATVALPPW